MARSRGLSWIIAQYGDGWLAETRQFDVPARLWKETLRDTMADIKAYRKAAKLKVRKAIRNRTSDEQERKRLYTLLKYDNWTEDNFLCRQMRKHYKHGKTSVDNQIVLDSCCYTAFERNGQAWVDVMGLARGKRIAIPLNTNRLLRNLTISRPNTRIETNSGPLRTPSRTSETRSSITILAERN